MKRITEYTKIETVSESDVLPIVDVSDTEQASTGSTRKGTIETIADYIKDRAETLTNKILTTARLNTPKINEDVTVTATSTELNKLDGVAGDIVGTTDTQTLTNKTMTNPTINFTDSAVSQNVRFSVDLSSAYAPSNTNMNTIQFNREAYDDGNDFSSYTFTAPVAGVYLFTCAARDANAVDGDYLQLELYKNSTTSIPLATTNNGAARAVSVFCSIQLKLAVSDTIVMRAANATRNPSWQSGGWTRMDGHLLSV